MSTREQRASRRADQRLKLLEAQLNVRYAALEQKAQLSQQPERKQPASAEQKELQHPTYKEIFGESEPDDDDDDDDIQKKEDDEEACKDFPPALESIY